MYQPPKKFVKAKFCKF